MKRPLDWIRLWSIAMGLVTLAAVLTVGGYLLVTGWPVLARESFAFLTEADWAYRQESWGAAAMIFGTAAVSLIAIIIAVPLGLTSALFISEIAHGRVRLHLKVLVELLAGVPSVVYGLLGIAFLRPLVADSGASLGLNIAQGDTILTGGILLSIMILPTVTTFSEDALAAVPRRAREAARGLGLTRAETIGAAILPRAFPGIIAAVLLALGRAAGETIAVFLVVGRADNRLPSSLFDLSVLLQPGQTITSKLGGSEVNIASGDPVHTSALMALALILFAGVIALTFLAGGVRRWLFQKVAA
ncbi:MAG: phosphate ABC transporter permease subunit PstC [Acidobacteria bacterium]|nr:phosphate ABC transporter permease subunit PstC [Acidobacteriota bacterium]